MAKKIKKVFKVLHMYIMSLTLTLYNHKRALCLKFGHIFSIAIIAREVYVHRNIFLAIFACSRKITPT